MEELVLILFAMAVAGAVAGFLAGLLGIGGGIVLVPALYFAFGAIGAPEPWHMHLTVATSLAIIIPTAFFSARAHAKRTAVELEIVRAWAPWVIIGAVAGAVLASHLKSAQLVLFFATVAFLMGIKLILPLEGKVLSGHPPKKPVSVILAAAIGTVSGLMGIGGATLSVPALTLFSVPIHKAIGTAALLGLVIAIPATIGYVWEGLGVAGLPPYSIGFVNLVGVAVVAPLSSLFAPVGVAIAHRLPRRGLSIIFGIFLIAAAVRMAYPVFDL